MTSFPSIAQRRGRSGNRITTTTRKICNSGGTILLLAVMYFPRQKGQRKYVTVVVLFCYLQLCTFRDKKDKELPPSARPAISPSILCKCASQTFTSDSTSR
eukprot:3794096-Rhodomonas_salina.1